MRFSHFHAVWFRRVGIASVACLALLGTSRLATSATHVADAGELDTTFSVEEEIDALHKRIDLLERHLLSVSPEAGRILLIGKEHTNQNTRVVFIDPDFPKSYDSDLLEHRSHKIGLNTAMSKRLDQLIKQSKPPGDGSTYPVDCTLIGGSGFELVAGMQIVKTQINDTEASWKSNRESLIKLNVVDGHCFLSMAAPQTASDEAASWLWCREVGYDKQEGVGIDYDEYREYGGEAGFTGRKNDLLGVGITEDELE